MSPDISERRFEEAIKCGVLDGGSDACQGGTAVREQPASYGSVDGVVYTTQPKEWTRLQQHHGVEVKERFLQRLAREIEQRFRTGVKPPST